MIPLGKLARLGIGLASVMKSNKKALTMAALGGVGTIGALNAFRGISIGQPRTMDEDRIRMMTHNPVLEAHNRRRGSHLSGQALNDRNSQLFRT